MSAELRSNLSFLECPLSLDIPDKNLAWQQSIICWLEDRKIRALDIEERIPLKELSSSWNAAVKSYLDGLLCPFAWISQNGNSIPPSNMDCLVWLTNEAISLEFEDLAESMDLAEDSTLEDAHTTKLTEVLGMTQKEQGMSSIRCDICLFIDFDNINYK